MKQTIVLGMELYKLTEKPELLETISRWHHEEWRHLNPGRSFASRLEDMQEHLAGKSIPATWIGYLDGQPAGSASILESDMPERPEFSPWLASVYTLEAFRHRGLGRRLVQAVMDHAVGLGIAKLYLYTPDKAHFYARLGWQGFETMQYHGTEVTLMSYTAGSKAE